MLKFYVITIFPDPIKAYLSESILKKAIEKQQISVDFYNPLSWAERSSNQEINKPIDDRPFGGGPGMVLKAKPFLKAIESAKSGIRGNAKIIYFSPRGNVFDTQMAKSMASNPAEGGGGKMLNFLKTGHFKAPDQHIILVSGRYEGIDSRVQEIFPGEEVSVGDFVLTGGELPAMILIDSIARQIPGVLGNFDSREEERVSAGKYYTRPEVLKWKEEEYKVPEVLLSGNHKKIEDWKQKN